MPLKQTLSRHWFRFQRELFPWLEETLGPLGERYERLVLELVRVEEWLPYSRGWRGRPLKDRAALARAFLAKAVLDVRMISNVGDLTTFQRFVQLCAGRTAQLINYSQLVSCLRNRITISDGGSTGKRSVREFLCVSANRHRSASPPRNLHRPKGFGRNSAVFGVAPPHNE